MLTAKILKFAPGFLGAFLLAISSSACRKEQTKWPGPTVAEELAVRSNNPDSPKEIENTALIQKGPVRFISYNLRNWIDGNSSRTKPDKEKAAAVRLITDYQPDIVGLCEIGTKGDLQNLQDSLSEKGLNLTYTYHCGGADKARHLAILSRYPIVETRTYQDLTYELHGNTLEMSRGILDATINTSIGEVRFLGAHLKSKREIPELDQEMIRRAEAHQLRDKADDILSVDPNIQLIVYGDFNDMRNSPTLRILKGTSADGSRLEMVNLKDDRGDSWTHYWKSQDVYSRFDYILTSQTLNGRILKDQSAIIDDQDWEIASDHRPLLVVFE